MGMRQSGFVHSNRTDFECVRVLSPQCDLDRFATQVFGNALFKCFVKTCNRHDLSPQVKGENSRIATPSRASDRPACKRSVDMDVAVGNHFGAWRDHRHHNQIAIAGVNLLARPDRAIDDHRIQYGLLERLGWLR